jgi:hypothetical protein
MTENKQDEKIFCAAKKGKQSAVFEGSTNNIFIISSQRRMLNLLRQLKLITTRLNSCK